MGVGLAQGIAQNNVMTTSSLTNSQQEKIKKIVALLTFLLDIRDEEIILLSLSSAIEMLKDFSTED